MRFCDQCGQVDDHPRFQYTDEGGSEWSWHYDCVPAKIRKIHEPQAPVGFAAVDEGKRGADVAAAVISAVDAEQEESK